MLSIQRKSALPAATEEGAHAKKQVCLHITTNPRFCQILRGITAGVSFMGMMGVVGGMENNTIGFAAGIVWTAALMAAWIVSLVKGGWLQ